ncbi:MAG TPA: oxidoreductase [Pseudonocardiaceae bacterium]|nr:oxidoreductase [Pseudonocardiaceae bacterium]
MTSSIELSGPAGAPSSEPAGAAVTAPFRSLVVGLGRAGTGLHLPTLARLRRTPQGRLLFDEHPPIGYDPGSAPYRTRVGALLLRDLDDAALRCDPDRTVVHLCTPPTQRMEPLDRLARMGFRNFLMEKPLAGDARSVAAIAAKRDRWRLRLVVVAHWQVSALTRRLATLVELGTLGAARSLSVIQRKPRFTRTAASTGHPTAFDVELPHSVGVALQLAGPATVVDAGLTDMVIGQRVIPDMGTASLSLRHASGLRTTIRSDLTSPVRERRMALRFEHGTAVAHYACGGDDDHARLRISAPGQHTTEVFPDDALGEFIRQAYQRFQRPEPVGADPDFERCCQVVGLLDAAKARCGR